MLEIQIQTYRRTTSGWVATVQDVRRIQPHPAGWEIVSRYGPQLIVNRDLVADEIQELFRNR